MVDRKPTVDNFSVLPNGGGCGGGWRMDQIPIFRFILWIGVDPILPSFQDWYLSLVLYLRWSCSLVSSFGWSNKPAKQGNEIKTKNLSHKNVDPKFFAFLPFNGLLVLKVNWRTLITSKLSEIKIKFSKRGWKYFFQSLFSSLAIWSKLHNKYI